MVLKGKALEKFQKGLYFTYDVLFALLLIFALFIFVGEYKRGGKEVDITFASLSSTASDYLQIMSMARLSNFFSNDYLNYLFSSSVLDQEDENKTIIEALGILWASENFSTARNLSAQFLDLVVNPEYSLSLWMEEGNNRTLVYSRGNLNNSNYIAKSERIISGIKRNAPKHGFVARARALTIEKNSTKVFDIPTEGAGNSGGKLEITKKFFFNASKINNATLYISVHYGSSNDEFESLTLNGANIKNNIVWLYQNPGSGTGAFGYVNVKDQLVLGNNTLYMRLKNNQYNAHVHPGMYLVIDYLSNEFYTTGNDTIKERIYFDNIRSEEASVGGTQHCYSSTSGVHRRTGVWATIPFFIPENALSYKATLNLNIQDVEDYWDNDRWHYEWRNGAWRVVSNNGNATDVRIYLNSNETNPIYRDGDYMCATSNDSNYNGYIDCPSLHQNLIGKKNVTLNLNLTPYLIKGTNTLSVYANTYEDWFCGRDYTEIYSDPATPENSSYIDIEYTIPKKELRFGFIDIGFLEKFGGVQSNPKQKSFRFQNYELLKSFLHIAQIFSFMINVDVQKQGETARRVFSSPASRAVPSAIFIDKSHFNVSKLNNISMFDTGSSENNFLPETSLEYIMLIPDHVSYGNTFDNEADARNDAISRLRTLLGNFTNATQIQVDSIAVGKVPWMWGPAKITLEVGR